MELTKELKEHILKALEWYEEDDPGIWFTKEEDLAQNKIAKEWLEAQEIPHPLHVSKEPCPYCNRFTTVWRTGDSGTINIRRCENCYKHYVYFTLHPKHGTKIVTEQEFHEMMNDPRPWPGEHAPMPDSPQALKFHWR